MNDDSQSQTNNSADQLQGQPNVSLPPPETAVSTPQQQPTQSPGTTDVLGIISVILPFMGLAIVGFIIGIIGVKKAKKEGYSPTLSWVGLIISGLFSVFVILVLVLLFGVAAVWV